MQITKTCTSEGCNTSITFGESTLSEDEINGTIYGIMLHRGWYLTLPVMVEGVENWCCPECTKRDYPTIEIRGLYQRKLKED